MATAAATLEEIAGAFLGELDRLADGMAARIGDEVPEFGLEAAPELHEALRRSCRANIDAGLRGLMRERRVPAEIPADARDLAAMSARLDVPLGATLRSYRIGHAVMWERWLAAVEARRPPAEMRPALLGDASRYMFQYTDRLSTYVAELYGAERERFLRGREQRRTQRVRDVLDGAEVDPAQALAVLDYDLRMEHVAAVVSGPEPDAALAALASALDAPHRLLVALAGEVAWAWAGRTRAVERTPAELDLPPGTTLALGDPGSGVDGFRRSHREARDAHQVALLRGTPVVRYDDVALEALVARDDARARAFAEHELRGIDGADARSVRLRHTLKAWFAAGQNASAAAAMLGVHEHTVHYRLKTIEDRLGRPVAPRHAELETALRALELRPPIARGNGL
jgi:hypothetical protein